MDAKYTISLGNILTKYSPLENMNCENASFYKLSNLFLKIFNFRLICAFIRKFSIVKQSL